MDITLKDASQHPMTLCDVMGPTDRRGGYRKQELKAESAHFAHTTAVLCHLVATHCPLVSPHS